MAIAGFSIILIVGLLMSTFVGINIGGSSTGVAFGPAVGGNVVSKVGAAALMSIFFLVGGWTVGRNVIDTMGKDIITISFSLEASVIILFFIGLALLVSNLSGVPASTSMTAVGSIVGLGVASGTTNWDTMGRIVIWWIGAPVLGFWIGLIIGRYIYPYLEAWFTIDQSEGKLIIMKPAFEVLGREVPYPTINPNKNRSEKIGSIIVLLIGCYLAFSAGASNTANAVAPLVGSGMDENIGVFLAGGAVTIGAFSIARRTLDTVGNDLTELPILAALVVSVTSATITTGLSYIGIPISLALTSIMCIVGLGWGRATRVSEISDFVLGRGRTKVSVNALTMEKEGDVPDMGEEDPDDIVHANALYNTRATGRVIILWVFTPTMAGLGSFILFTLFPVW